ncbi:flavin reductase (DIM6/NTAB) family NADH-FMN oxidoreductase RutF [Microterricola gilva]|uniref:Flavin reductase (DIM6/NTAB) family NADH-FMN oxidoreductase RutF n=1 Tax=Microterricola gilva TaxID=393267 RepID=A0A4Q8AP97_9MICO|nr:flavin reductase family protein [Microterricola gilva]RZU65789.1 flavin reductase (DIM6/NTAB) family NADH-FMN oxidoreductase RutF [Microterricola gilva]
MPTHFYRPAEGHRLAHDPLNAIIAPRPIGWIGTLSPAGVRNLAPYSFFNAFSYTPPLIGFSSTSRKHSARNAELSGEFTWNLVTRALAEQMNATSTTGEVDEFEAAGLDAAASVEIAAPRVAASPVSFECRVSQIVPLRGADGRESAGVLTIGEVVAVHIDEALLQDGLYQTALAHPVLRGGGPTAYFEVLADGRFDMRRPR